MTAQTEAKMPTWMGMVLSILFGACTVAEEPVHFNDANLKAAVEQTLGKTDPTPTDMLALTVLHARFRDIAGLTGLEYATNLQWLYLGWNQIDDVSALASLTNLQELELDQNEINDVSALAGLTSLQLLYLGSNHITDISALSGLTNLQGLELGNNQISDISALAGLTSLRGLNLASNEISNLSPLTGLTSLHSLRLQNNQISNLTALAGLANLDILHLEDNQISNLSPLAGLTNLHILYLDDNRISDVLPLAGLTSLHDLHVQDNWIRNISGLVALTNLRGSLDLRDNLLNSDAYALHIPQIRQNNPDITIYYDLFTLNITSNGNGSVAGSGTYDWGSTVPITATPDARYDFSYWIKSGSVTVADPNSASTTVTIYGNGTVKAVFDIHRYALTVAVTGYGSVLTPGEGRFKVASGTMLPIEAVPSDSSYEFEKWSGTAVESDKVQEPNATKTAILVDADYTLQAVFVERTEGPSLGFSLGDLGMNDRAQFDYRVTTNTDLENLFDPDIVAEWPPPSAWLPPFGWLPLELPLLDGVSVDLPYAMLASNGMLRMRPGSLEAARAKMRFGRCDAERVLVRFEYFFESLGSSELIVYLSNVPELLERSSPQRSEHYVEIGRIGNPPQGRPGSVGSNRFGVFEAWVSTGGLDLSQGTWVELELAWTGDIPIPFDPFEEGIWFAASAEEGATFVDSLAVRVICSGICMDLNWSDTADEEDFLLAIASYGHGPDLGEEDRAKLYCLDGVFSDDGYMDLYDIHSMDWGTRDEKAVGSENLCHVPLMRAGGGSAGMGSLYPPLTTSGSGLVAAGQELWPTELLIVGKSRRVAQDSDLLADSFYPSSTRLSHEATYTAVSPPDRCNVRAVRGPASEVYLVNSERGVLRLGDTIEEVIPPDRVSDVNDPRYPDGLATAYIGMQGQGASAFGRPILDVAFDRYGFAYIAPVVVESAGGEVYVAAAKLELRKGGSPPYGVLRLYDDPPPAGDNQHRNYVREVEVDDANNVYLVNVHSRNESCILWKYDPNGELLLRLDLTKPDSPVKVEDPLALHLSRDGQTLYLASGQYHRPDPNNTVVYALSTKDFSLTRSLTIRGMQFVTSIAEDPNSLWVVGFSMPEIPKIPSPLAEPFYQPYLAQISAGADANDAVPLADPTTHNLALPTSIVWLEDE